jgi:DNA-binding CsgD family transcriptional regulator
VLVGRRSEAEAIDGLIAGVRGGMSGALVLRGEPGIGKTALLDYGAASASDFRVVRIVGIESEMELGFAGLHQLIHGFENRLSRLPQPQRDALLSAFGRLPGSPPDRFLVGLGVLTLLADIARESPLLCIVDDVDWLDRESVEILAFVARRLMADRVGFLFAARGESNLRSALEGIGVLQIDGIPADDARDLLASVVDGPIDTQVADRIIGAAMGNPLALIELAFDLTPAQLRGTALLPEPLPIGARLQETFLRRVRLLPAGAQTLLLLASAEPSGDPRLLWRAAQHLGLSLEALRQPEAERFVSVGSQVAFRHPLIRSAVYHSASLHQRQRIHEALAAASDPVVDPDRRAWHLAAGAVGPDEAIAAELEKGADRALARGGYAAAAAFLTRSADLTSKDSQRVDRLLAAAEAELNRGGADRAEVLLSQASPQLIDPLASARALRLAGMIDYARGQLADAPSVLVQAAQMLRPLDLQLGKDTMLEAIQASLYAGQFGRNAARSAGTAARAFLSARPAGVSVSDLLLEGYATSFTEGRPAALPQLRQATTVLEGDVVHGKADLRWFMLGCLAASELWDDRAQYGLAIRWVALARQMGALTALPVALNYIGWYEVMEGRPEAGRASLSEGREISQAIANAGIVGDSGAGNLLRLVCVGAETEARAAAVAMMRDGIQRSQGASLTHARSALTMLELSLGNYEAAAAQGREVFDEDLFYLGSLTLPDLVEAGSRSGDHQIAEAALDRLRERANACHTEWALGLLARSAALMAGDDAADDLYLESIERLERCRIAPDLARAHLVYGEWLRRQGRRREARDQLRKAVEMFDSTGFEAFANRTRIELRATGEHARKRSVETQDQLTPQEAQIGRMAGEGARNQEIAAQLFISPATVEYHLTKVFRKLGVSSRTQLARVISSESMSLQTAGR